MLTYGLRMRMLIRSTRMAVSFIPMAESRAVCKDTENISYILFISHAKNSILKAVVNNYQ